MKRKKVMLSIMIAAITVISYSSRAQQDNTDQNTDPTKTQQSMDEKKRMDEQIRMNQNAQGQNQTDPVNPQDSRMQNNMKTDHIMMQNGKIVMMKDGKMTEMNKDMTLSDGSKVMSDGKIMMKDGTSKMLKDGDMIDMNGKMMMSDKKMMNDSIKVK